MKRARRRAAARTESKLLCLEQLETRLPLSAVSHWESQSFGGERNDFRDNSMGQVQALDVDSHIGRSSNREDSGHRASPNNDNDRTNRVAENQNQIIVVQQSSVTHQSENRLRPTTERAVAQFTIRQMSPRSRTFSPTGSIDQNTASTRTTTSPTATTTIIRLPQVKEPESTTLARPTFVASAPIGLADSLVAFSTPTNVEANRGLAASVFRLLGPADERRDAGPADAPPRNRLIPLAWWVAENENDDETESDDTNSFDTATSRFGGVVDIQRMPLLLDTLPLIKRQSTTKDEIDSEPDGELDDLILRPKLHEGLDDEQKAESPTEKRDEARIADADMLPTPRSEAIDMAFAEAESVEQFGGLIEVPLKIAAKSIAEDELSYDTMVPINALQVDVIMGQAPLLELNDEPMEEDKPVDDPVSINIQPAATTNAALTLIPAIVHARRKSERGGSTHERGAFIPE